VVDSGTYDPAVTLHYMDGVRARQVVTAMYHNNDVVFGGNASTQTPLGAEDELVIRDFSMTNNVFMSRHKTLTTQTSKSKRGRVGEGAPERTGSLALRHIRDYCDHISISGMTPDQVAHVKSNELYAIVTGQFPFGSTYKIEECTGNNNLLGFDFDNTEILIDDLLHIFKGVELLYYTTISDDPNSKKRRYRIILECNRCMTIQEHRILMDYYRSQIEEFADDYCLEHGLDAGKLTPWSKFYLPHRESDKKHMKRDRKPLDVDKLLHRIPVKPIVISPTLDDLEYKDITGNPIAKSKKSLFDKCNDLIDQMVPNGRSYLATKVGRRTRYLNANQREFLFARMVEKGVSESALKSARKYSRGY
jgi:hypothetical protein